MADTRQMSQQQLIIEAHILLNKIEKTVNYIVNDIQRKRAEDGQRAAT